MRVISPKPSEFGQGEKEARGGCLASKAQQSAEHVLGLRHAVKPGGVAFWSVEGTSCSKKRKKMSFVFCINPG